MTRRPLLPREHYEQVAEVWLAEYRRRGGKPNVAVAAKWSVPYSTAAGWVKRARRLGVLVQPFKRAHVCECGRYIDCARGEV